MSIKWSFAQGEPSLSVWVVISSGPLISSNEPVMTLDCEHPFACSDEIREVFFKIDNSFIVTSSCSQIFHQMLNHWATVSVGVDSQCTSLSFSIWYYSSKSYTVCRDITVNYSQGFSHSAGYKELLFPLSCKSQLNS